MSFDCLNRDLADTYIHTRIERVPSVNNGNLRLIPVEERYRKNFWSCSPAVFTAAAALANLPNNDAFMVTGTMASTRSDNNGNVWAERIVRHEVEVPITDIFGKLRKLFCCCCPC